MGLTQAQLAQKMDVSTRTVYSWESGEARFPLDKFLSLCSVLEISPDVMLGCSAEGQSDQQKQLLNRVNALDARGKSAMELFLSMEEQLTEGTQEAQEPEDAVVPFQGPLYLSRKDPDYMECRKYCTLIDQQQRMSEETDYDVVKMLWRLGLTDVDLQDMRRIKEGIRVPSPALAHVILHILERSYTIEIPSQPPACMRSIG